MVIGPIQDDELDQDQEERRERLGIATPNPTGLPAANLRGLNLPKPTTPSSSSSPAPTTLAPAPAAPITKPSALDQKTEADTNELARLEKTGSGVAQIARAHPVAGGILRGLGVVGSAAGRMMPILGGALSVVPGTEEHHHLLEKEATHRVANDVEAQEREAATGEHKAAAEKDTAQAEAARRNDALTRALLTKGYTMTQDANGNPVLQEIPGFVRGAEEPQWDKNGDLVGFKVGDKLIGLNDPNLTPGMKAIVDAAKPKTPEPDKPLGEKVPQLNKMLTDRYQVLNAGKDLPAEYVLPANATRADYERIDKALEAEERARGTKAQQDQANAMREQAHALAQEKADEQKADNVSRYASIQSAINQMADVAPLFDKPGVGIALAEALTPQVEHLPVGGLIAGVPAGISIPAGALDNFITRGVISAAQAQALINRYNLTAEAAIQFLMVQQGGKIGRGGPSLMQQVQNLIPGSKTTSAADARDKLNLFQNQFDIWKKNHPQFAKDLTSFRDKGYTPSNVELGTNTVSFKDGADIYDVPADKVDAFKAKHPNAQQQK